MESKAIEVFFNSIYCDIYIEANTACCMSWDIYVIADTAGCMLCDIYIRAYR